MKTINTIIYYLYIPLGIAILVCLIILLSRVVKLLKQVGQTLQSTAPINDHLQKINAASKRIGKTKGSWTFYLALGGGLSLLKDARKNYQKKNLCLSPSPKRRSPMAHRFPNCVSKRGFPLFLFSFSLCS